MEAQVSLTVAFSSSSFFSLLFLIFLLTILHRFSIGFRSGEFAGQLSRNGQALPSVNHYDPNHLSSNHEHLHLITTITTTTIRAPATVHSPSDLVSHYVDYTPAYTKLSIYLAYLPVSPYLLCHSLCSTLPPDRLSA